MAKVRSNISCRSHKSAAAPFPSYSPLLLHASLSLQNKTIPVECGGVNQLHQTLSEYSPKAGLGNKAPPSSRIIPRSPCPWSQEKGRNNPLLNLIYLSVWSEDLTICLYKVPSNFLNICALLPALCSCSIPGSLVAQETDPSEKQSLFGWLWFPAGSAHCGLPWQLKGELQTHPLSCFEPRVFNQQQVEISPHT